MEALQVQVKVDVLLHMRPAIHLDKESITSNQGFDRFKKRLIFLVCAADDAFADATPRLLISLVHDKFNAFPMGSCLHQLQLLLASRHIVAPDVDFRARVGEKGFVSLAAVFDTGDNFLNEAGLLF